MVEALILDGAPGLLIQIAVGGGFFIRRRASTSLFEAPTCLHLLGKLFLGIDGALLGLFAFYPSVLSHVKGASRFWLHRQVYSWPQF